MKELEKFISKNKIKLSEKELQLCQIAYSKMQKSKDPMHNEIHILDSLELVDVFLNSKNYKNNFEIDVNVVILSVFWHDTWKSKNIPTNPINFYFHQHIEGLLSAELFTKSASHLKLDREKINKVAYAIRKHSHYQYLKPKTNEAKFLCDLDALELYNFERYKRSQDKFFLLKNKFFCRLMLSSLKKFSPEELHTIWARKTLEKRKTKFLKRMNDYFL